MKHILLEFSETPDQYDIDLSKITYDNDLNLNVLKNTKIPAITFADQQTETFTKTNGEGSDSDNDMKYKIAPLLTTSTQTRTHNEASDCDSKYNLSNLLDTSTQTFINSEVSDSDKNIRDLDYLSAT